jgi:hypothetical protein
MTWSEHRILGFNIQETHQIVTKAPLTYDMTVGMQKFVAGMLTVLYLTALPELACI